MRLQPDMRARGVTAAAIEPVRDGAIHANRDFPAPAGGHRLGRNVFWNLAGSVAPGLAAVACIPILVHALGAQRFGALTIAWALIAGSGFLDFASIALTKLIAERIGNGRREEIPPLFWIAFLFTAASSAMFA